MGSNVLIVEDNDLVRESLRVWLTIAFPQCSFMEATCGEDALDLAVSQAPDLVLMDVGLPEMNGIETTRLIRQACPQTRVIILSIQEDTHYITDALAAGACSYVPKRKMHNELVPIMTRLLASTGAAE